MNIEKTDFNLELPTKLIRLLHRRDRSSLKSEQQIENSSTNGCLMNNQKKNKNKNCFYFV